MANEFRCSECDGDGTRCECHKKRPPVPRQKSVEEKIAENEEKIRFYRGLIDDMIDEGR